MSSLKPFKLYSVGTPNGWKVTVTLEELGIPYEFKNMALKDNEQKEAWFLKINPNGRAPAMVDPNQNDLVTFESGSMIHYLAMNYDPEHKLWPKDLAGQAECMNWLMFQMAGVGPIQGQVAWFVHYAPDNTKNALSLKRYADECRRLFEVLDAHLAGKEWLAAGQFTIADIATASWIIASNFVGVKIDDLVNLTAWEARFKARPAVMRGLNVPTPNFCFAGGAAGAKKMYDHAVAVKVNAV